MNNSIINIGEHLKTLREQSGLTQMNLADFLKVDQSLISKIEKNERVVSVDMLERIASLFGLTIEDLMAEKLGKSSITIALRATSINVEDLEVISNINQIALNLNFMIRLLGVEDDR